MNSVKKAMISAVAVASVVAVAAPVNAEYPPIEDVKPSTIISTISFDRTPATVDSESRKVLSTVSPGATTSIKVFVGESFTPVIPNCPPASNFRETITTSDGRTLTWPSVRSLNNGRLRLPTLAIANSGSYTIKATAPNGKVRTIRVNSGR